MLAEMKHRKTQIIDLRINEKYLMQLATELASQDKRGTAIDAVERMAMICLHLLADSSHMGGGFKQVAHSVQILGDTAIQVAL
jgi:hypothetical protein